MEIVQYNKVLIAVDGSKHSYLVAEKVLMLARQLNARVALIFVIDKGKTLGSVDANITHNEAEIILKKEAVTIFDNIAATFETNDFLRYMIVGYPKEDILKIAETWQASLIVIGTHGKSGVVNILLGSVAEYIIHHSSIPVMTVR